MAHAVTLFVLRHPFIQGYPMIAAKSLHRPDLPMAEKAASILPFLTRVMTDEVVQLIDPDGDFILTTVQREFENKEPHGLVFVGHFAVHHLGSLFSDLRNDYWQHFILEFVGSRNKQQLVMQLLKYFYRKFSRHSMTQFQENGFKKEFVNAHWRQLKTRRI